MAEKKQYGLRLTLGGAPNTPHVIPGLGYVQVDPPAPVGGPGEPSLERARRAAEDPGCSVELVELTAKEATAAREHMVGVRERGARGLMWTERNDPAMPQETIDDEAAALRGGGEG